MLSSTATHLTSDRLDSLTAYWKFYRAVASEQRARWLPRASSRILDLAGERETGGPSAAQAAAAGHSVLCLREPPEGPTPRHDRLDHPNGRLRVVYGDSVSLACLRDGCVDAVIADDGVLSRHLLGEMLAGELARVLRPGGRMIASADSLVLGMGMLAGQRAWAELSDVPSAEVVLVPWPDGTFTRCFGAGQMREVLSEAGFEVEWIRPRTMLSPLTVEEILTREPGAMDRLVRAELQASRPDESVGIHLVASARRRRHLG